MKPGVDRAVKIFSSISGQLGPQYLAYLTLPNVVLTMCGARAYCDGIFWQNDNENLLKKWHKELSTLMEAVKGQGVTLWSDTAIEQAVVSGKKYAGFELITRDGLRYAIAHTDLLGSIRPEDIEAEELSTSMTELLTTDLRKQSALKDYPKESLHDIAFGILLGYPDEAISESVLRWGDDDPFAEPLIDADIRGANYYVCPQPVYLYPRRLVANSAIVAHEKLWSGLLKGYYQSDFHTSLEKNRNFQAKLRELGVLR